MIMGKTSYFTSELRLRSSEISNIVRGLELLSKEHPKDESIKKLKSELEQISTLPQIRSLRKYGMTDESRNNWE